MHWAKNHKQHYWQACFERQFCELLICCNGFWHSA